MCLHASLVAMGNLAVVLTMFIVRLKEEVRRLKAGQVDISVWTCVCFCQKSRPANPDVSSWGSTSQAFISTKLGPCLVQVPVWLSVMFLTVILLVLAFVSMPQMGNGWILYHFVHQGTNQFYAMRAVTEAFSLWEVYVDINSLSIPQRQQDMTNFFFALQTDAKVYPNLAPTKLDMFSLQMLLGGGPTLLGGCLDNSYSPKDPSECTPVYWTSPFLDAIAQGLGLPFWIFGLVLNEQFYDLYAVWTSVPTDPWEPILTPRTLLNDYSNADLVKAFEDAWDAHTHVVNWVDIYYVIDVKDNWAIDENIEWHRTTANNNALSGRMAYNNLLIWYWEIFAYCQDLFSTSLTSVSICVFGVTWGLLRSLKAAFVGTTMDLVIVFQTWGSIANWAEFNIFTYAFLLLAFGISVEFTAHTIAYFEIAKGDAVQRLRIAMRATVPPVILGGWSTMLALFPLWFGPMIFGYMYCSSVLTTLTFLGFLNGIIVLPCFLACVAFMLGLCGMGMQRVSSKRNSKGSQPDPETPASEQNAADGSTKSKDEAMDYAVDLDDAPVSPVRKFEARGHFNQV